MREMEVCRKDGEKSRSQGTWAACTSSFSESIERKPEPRQTLVPTQ